MSGLRKCSSTSKPTLWQWLREALTFKHNQVMLSGFTHWATHTGNYAFDSGCVRCRINQLGWVLILVAITFVGWLLVVLAFSL